MAQRFDKAYEPEDDVEWEGGPGIYDVLPGLMLAPLLIWSGVIFGWHFIAYFARHTNWSKAGEGARQEAAIWRQISCDRRRRRSLPRKG